MQSNFRKLIALLLFVWGYMSPVFSQTLFWRDNFEDSGAPSSGSRTPSVEFSCSTPATAYFFRTDPANLSLVAGSYSNYEGIKIWAAEDIDKGPVCVNASVSANQTISWANINITGKTGLSFRGLFAANSSTPGAWEGSSYGISQDFLAVEYRIDGGAWTPLVGFYASNTTQSQTLKLETTGDLVGEGADLTNVFGEFTANIAGTGTTLELRFNCYSNGTVNEEFAIDNFRLYETPACVAPTITAQPPNRSICTNSNTTFAVTATGATAYQWQVNTGSGFSNISNGGVYSNATTNTLSITSAGSAMNGYVYRCITYSGGGVCSATSNSGTLTVSTITNSNSQTNISCFGASTGIATVTASGGVSPYSYSWSPVGGSSATATGLPAGNYVVTITDNIGCTAQQNFIITQPSQSPGADNYSLPTSNQTIVQTVNSYNYVSSSCQLINAVLPSGANPVSGSVTSNLWIESSVPTHAGIPYVQRHYEITPAVNASSVTGTITLYFTQAEFDAFNVHAGSSLDLPTGPSDAAGKANLRIGKYSGISGDGTGLPSSYSSSAIVIDPDDNNIVWNATSNAWEVSFAVSGFSGFIVQSVSGTLPVSWASFEVLQKQGTAFLLWSTSLEQDASHFVIEHSTNGSNWVQVGTVAAGGNSSSTMHYQFTHSHPVKGTNAYRIQQRDINGNIHFSAVKHLRLSAIENTVDVLSNPVENGVLKILVHNRTQLISLINSSGHTVWQQQVAAGVHSIPVAAFTKGIYLLRTESGTNRIIFK